MGVWEPSKKHSICNIDLYIHNISVCLSMHISMHIWRDTLKKPFKVALP